MNKQQRDNRANQMNPNNIAYYKSRMGNTPKKQTNTKSNQKKSSNHYTSNTKNVKVVHVHNNHNHTNQNLGYRCPVCGKAGGLHTTMFGMKCDHCGGRFSKYDVIM